MDSIVFTHTGTCSGDACSLESALEHFSGYLDAEQDTLACILAQAGCIHAASVLDTLAQLHLEPNAVEADLRDLLEEAEACLFLLLETVRQIPSRELLKTAWELPGPEVYDAHLRWSGARLEEIVRTLAGALWK